MSIQIPPGTPLHMFFGKRKTPLPSSFPPGTLSINMIVKNEVKNIEAAVDSIKTCADEIVINDTGSTDGTQALLKRMNVNWFQTVWTNDFSTSRNQVIENSRCQWIFWMDADDRLSPELVTYLNEAKHRTTDFIAGFEVINTEPGQSMGARFFQTRLFPNHSDLRFERTIHEQIEPAAAALGLQCIYQPLSIFHLGYSDPVAKKAKARRNLALIIADEHRLKHDPSFALTLGDCYYILNDWESGIEAYRAVLSIPNCKSINADIYNEIPLCIGLGFLHLKNWPQALDWLDQGIKGKPEKLEGYAYKAQILETLERPEEALALYLKMTKMKKPHTGTVNRYDILHMRSFYNAARIQRTLQLPDAAIQTLLQMQNRYPNIIDSYHLLGKCFLNKSEPKKAVATWIKALQLNPAASLSLYRDLLDTLESLGQKALVSQINQLAKKHFSTEFT